MEKFWKKRKQVWIQIMRKQRWVIFVVSKCPSLFCKLFKYLAPFLCHFATLNREYYERLWRLQRHIQVGRLSFQRTWLGLVTQFVILGSMWPTGKTSNKSVINFRWWRCPLPSGLSLALPHSSSWLETHFVLLLAKIIEYIVFHLSLCHWFVFVET